jgi:tRNA(fMet)-specific endonuclease VapC
MILDSTFLVDFERERRKKSEGAATAFLRTHPDNHFCITFTIAGELAAGKSMGSNRSEWSSYLQPFRLLESSIDISWEFGRIYRLLQSKGTLIGANDLWIGATGLTHTLPVVTRNVKDFQRIPGLDVLGY